MKNKLQINLRLQFFSFSLSYTFSPLFFHYHNIISDEEKKKKKDTHELIIHLAHKYLNHILVSVKMVQIYWNRNQTAATEAPLPVDN